MNEIQIVGAIYKQFVDRIDEKNGTIPIDLRAPSLVGTVQDDPFDNWVSEEISNCLSNLEIHHAGKLTTPDLALRHPDTKSIIGLEVKKLIQQENGADLDCNVRLSAAGLHQIPVEIEPIHATAVTPVATEFV